MKGATQEPYDYLMQFLVSIHTPVKGATPDEFDWDKPMTVSIHTPVKGATTACPLTLSAKAVFQSTRP